MRPVTIIPPPNYKVPPTQKFSNLKGGVPNPVNLVFHVSANTAIQTTAILQKMLYYFLNKPKNKTESEALRLMKVRIDGYYGNARSDLINNVGQFCSFCGIPVLDSSLAIEHTLPKAQFPDLTVDYQNFLLACPVCNSNKGSNPTFSEAKSWTGSQNPSYNQIKQAGLGHFLWAKNKMAYRGFYPSFYYYDKPNKTWKAISVPAALNINNNFVKTQGIEVNANIWTLNGMVNYWVKIKVDAKNPPAANMINLIKQNKYEMNDPKVSDRRIMNLTKTWLRITEALKSLSIAASSGNNTVVSIVYNQLLSLSSSTGFYYLWVFILQVHSNTNNWAGKFVADTNNYKYYPGTDTKDVP